MKKQLGHVIEQGEPALGAQDFALMAEIVPISSCVLARPARAKRSLARFAYQPDERCIGLSVKALARATLEILS